MKFTIYSGFYNNVEFLPQIWEGIKNQTYDNWEWIITDDFSDDPNDLKILQEFADKHDNVKCVTPRWKKEFYYNPPVEFSSGDIMLVQDVDDYPFPKLLEVYKYHFEMFPSVEMISCSSLIRENSIDGRIAFVKDCNYLPLFNYYEATYSENNLVRSMGDARAYRIHSREPNEFAYEGQYFTFADDLIKTFHIEKRGKILFLPRLLHIYSQESKSSISFQKHDEDYIKRLLEENESLYPEIHKENAEYIDSIEHYYSLVYDSVDTLLFHDLYSTDKEIIADVWYSKLDAGSKNRIKHLYFDWDISYNKVSETSNCAFFRISNEDDFNMFHLNVNHYLTNNKKVFITIKDREYDEKVSYVLNRPHYWLDWNGKKRIICL